MTSVNDYNKIIKLAGHMKRIVFIKYFMNPYTNQQYLISGDREEIVKIWEIENEVTYKLLCSIRTNYGRLITQQSIYNCLLYFTESKNYIYTTTVTTNHGRLYELENGAFIKDVLITLNNYTFYLIKYKDYIIDCCRHFFMIYNPFNEEIYDRIENDLLKGDNASACIIYNKDNTDYLFVSNYYGNIIMYDLKQKCIKNTFYLNKKLFHIIAWDYNNLVVTEYNSEFLGFLNINERIISNSVKIKKTLMCVKKILLNEKDELLFTAGEDYKEIYMLFSSNALVPVSTQPPVPGLIPARASMPGLIPARASVPGPIPARASVPGPIPAQAPVPGLIPAQVPVPGPIPAQVPVPGPIPAQAPVPGPIPAQAPVPGPIPDPAPAPVPGSAPAPFPAPVSIITPLSSN